MARLIDLTGKKFNRLTIIKRLPNRKGIVYWLCLCDCGNYHEARGKHLKCGNIKSCGCLQKELTIKRSKTHGLTKDKLYKRFRSIIQRCHYKNSINYKNYGGRGIKVCDEWRNDFMTFYNWAHESGYQDGLWIDRIDNDGNYEPSNCRWVTPRKSASHKRTTSKHGVGVFKRLDGKFQVRVQAFGKRQCLGTFKNSKKAQQTYENYIKEHNLE
jgi:hypothetical protein